MGCLIPQLQGNIPRLPFLEGWDSSALIMTRHMCRQFIENLNQALKIAWTPNQYHCTMPNFIDACIWKVQSSQSHLLFQWSFSRNINPHKSLKQTNIMKELSFSNICFLLFTQYKRKYPELMYHGQLWNYLLRVSLVLIITNFTGPLLFYWIMKQAELNRLR